MENRKETGGHQTLSDAGAGAGSAGNGIKSEASMGIPWDFAKPSKIDACLTGTSPPVPPFSFGWHQFQTRVLWTPTMAATFEGPPRSLMMVDAGSMESKVSNFETIRQVESLEIRDRLLSRFPLQKAMTNDNPIIKSDEDAAQWVKRAMLHAGIDGAELARRLTQYGQVNDEQRGIVSKMITPDRKTGKYRALKVVEMFAISEITGYPIPTKGNSLSSLISQLSPRQKNKVIEYVNDLRGVYRPDAVSSDEELEFNIDLENPLASIPPHSSVKRAKRS